MPAIVIRRSPARLVSFSGCIGTLVLALGSGRLAEPFVRRRQSLDQLVSAQVGRGHRQSAGAVASRRPRGPGAWAAGVRAVARTGADLPPVAPRGPPGRGPHRPRAGVLPTLHPPTARADRALLPTEARAAGPAAARGPGPASAGSGTGRRRTPRPAGRRSPPGACTAPPSPGSCSPARAPRPSRGNSGAPAVGEDLLQLRRHLAGQQLGAGQRLLGQGDLGLGPDQLGERVSADRDLVRLGPRALHPGPHLARGRPPARSPDPCGRTLRPRVSRPPMANDSSTARNRATTRCEPIAPRAVRAFRPPSTARGVDGGIPPLAATGCRPAGRSFDHRPGLEPEQLGAAGRWTAR